jgi:hypothetical protein
MFVIAEHHARQSRTLLGGDLTLMSVTAELIPDLLVARSEGDRARLTVIDAKQRSGAVMTGAAIAEAAAKYVWGLRDAHRRDDVAIDTVIIASPTSVTAMLDPSRARIRSVTCRPGDVGTLKTEVAALADGFGLSAASTEEPSPPL